MRSATARLLFVASGFPLAAGLATGAEPIGTAFTYQGQLKRAGVPADGFYDLEFTLYDSETDGSALAGSIVFAGHLVSNGLFTVALDFEADIFKGEACWLEIGVRSGGDTGPYTYLSPRQKITPAPYALALPGLRTQQNVDCPNVIGGHRENTIGTGVHGATIGGGGYAGTPNSVTGSFGTVGGGQQNTVLNRWATVAGGISNVAGTTEPPGGGPGGAGAFVGGGAANQASGQSSVVPGGENNVAGGRFSFAAGRSAKALHDGTFVWRDFSEPSGPFESTGENQFLIQAAGGVGIGTDTPEGVLDVRGPNGGDIHVGVNDVGARIISTDAAGNLNLRPRVDGAGVFVRDGNTNKGIRLYGGGTNIVQSVDLDGTSPFALSINPDGGNVGIGTDTPSARLDIAGGDIHLDADRAIRFADNGQITSHDDKHALLFRRSENKLELREYGDIILSAGATNNQETASVVVKGSGRVGVGTDTPEAALHVDTAGSDAVRGVTQSSEVAGVHGINNSPTEGAVGVLGETSGFHFGDLAAGVRGRTTPGSEGGYGVLGTQGAEPTVVMSGGAGVFGFSDESHGVSGITTGAGPLGLGNVVGVLGYAVTDAPLSVGVVGETDSTTGSGVEGVALSLEGLNYGGRFHTNSSQGYGVSANTNSTNVQVAEGPAGLHAAGGTAIRGVSTVSGGIGVIGIANDTFAYGVYGESDIGHAGHFEGYVLVNGDLGVTGDKTFVIDHPLDPANKYLAHSCVESSERLNVYRGNVQLDDAGEASVQLPDWFDAVNANISYQLTAVGAAAPGLHVAEKVENNEFRIAGGVPGMEVSWTVMAERADAHTRGNPFVVERDKSEHERGYYLQPELCGHGTEKGMIAAKRALSERMQSGPQVIAEQERRRREMTKRWPLAVRRGDTVTEPAQANSGAGGG